MIHDEPKRLDIELYFSGELGKIEADELEKHFDDCPVCFNYLQVLRREKNEFLAEHSFESFYPVQRAKITLPWYRQFFVNMYKPNLVPLYGLLLIAAIAVPLVTSYRSILSDDIRTKGKPSLSFIYKRDGSVFEGILTEKFREHDQIQILYSSERDQYITLLSVDSKGTVSFYHPEENSLICSIKSGSGSKLSYPESIVLDNTAGAELIIAVFSSKPLTTENVKGWIITLFNKAASLDNLEQMLKKENAFSGASTETLLLSKG